MPTAPIIKRRIAQFGDWDSVPVGTFVKKMEDGSVGYEEVYTKLEVDQKILDAIQSFIDEGDIIRLR